jgi:hypothetical protein
MDGALLVFDSRSLPNMHALAPVEAPLVAKAHWRHRTFPAMAALILATVLSLVYFVSTQRGVPSSAPVGVPSVSLPASNLVAPAAESNPAPPPASTESSAAPALKEEEKKPQETKPHASTTAPKATSKTSTTTSKTSTTTTQRKPAEEPKKDDSKVGSVLKKTGRILKKPFKL